MTRDRPAFHLRDEHALDVLAHPLRGRLLGFLRAEGPATASGLAARVGESSGVTSYHLRKLADVGLVAEDVERGTRRERWWRPVHEVTTYSAADFLGNPEAHRATVSMRREIYRWQQRLLQQWLIEEADWDKAWVDAAGSSDDVLRLTPARAKAMTDEIWSVVERYRSEGAGDEAPDAERVVFIEHLVPIRGELPF